MDKVKMTKVAKDSWSFNIDDGSPDESPHNLSIYISSGPTGVFVGHIKQFPGIIVQAETKDKLAEEALNSIDFLWKNCPETHDKVFPSHISAKEVIRQGLGFRKQLQAIEVAVPNF